MEKIMSDYNIKDLIGMSQSKNAVDFVSSVNNILAAKVHSKIQSMTPEVASKMFKGGYLPKSGDEQAFVDKHTISVVDYPVENKDGLPFKDDSMPHKSAKEQLPASYSKEQEVAAYT